MHQWVGCVSYEEKVVMREKKVAFEREIGGVPARER